MFSFMNPEDALAAVVDAMAPVGNPNGVYFAVQVEMTNKAAADNPIRPFDETADDNWACRSAFVHMLFDRRQNYVKVWACKTHATFLPPPEAWKMYSYHDSCWRSDGFGIFREVWRQFSTELALPEGGNRMHTTAWLERARLVCIEDAPAEDKKFPHHRKVVSVKDTGVVK